MAYNLKKYYFTVVDPQGIPITSGLKASVLIADGAIATIYADDQKGSTVTNPITSTAFATAGGLITFWYAGSTVDLEIVSEEGAAMKAEGLTPATHQVTFDVDRADVQLVYANIAAGAELVDATATFVDFPNSVTIAGENLKAGDVLNIRGTVLFADFNSGDTMDLKVLLGTEAILQTGDVTPAANDDVIAFDLWVTVNTAGASGALMVTGEWSKDLNGTVTRYLVSPTGAAKSVSEDISGDVIIKAQGDYSAAHADNEAYLVDLKVIKYKNGNV